MAQLATAVSDLALSAYVRLCGPSEVDMGASAREGRESYLSEVAAGRTSPVPSPTVRVSSHDLGMDPKGNHRGSDGVVRLSRQPGSQQERAPKLERVRQDASTELINCLPCGAVYLGKAPETAGERSGCPPHRHTRFLVSSR